MTDRDRFMLPLGLLVVAVFLMVAFQTVQLVRERSNLAAIHAAQEASIQEGAKLRQQLEALAGETAKLAEAGDAGAKAVVEEPRRQGVNLKPPAK